MPHLKSFSHQTPEDFGINNKKNNFNMPSSRTASAAKERTRLGTKRSSRTTDSLETPVRAQDESNNSLHRQVGELSNKHPDRTEEDLEGLFVTQKSALPVRFTYVDSKDLVTNMVDQIMALEDPAIYMDLEGVDLHRNGEICTLQLCIETGKGAHAYLVDVLILQKTAFTTFGRQNMDVSFKSILENTTIPKLFWDCRMDSDALYAQFSIALEAVIDIQLMEVAQRGSNESKRYLRGYGLCVDQDPKLDPSICKEIRETKAFQASFIPDKGGDWAVLKERPMCHRLKKYCVGDIRYMPQLFRTYGQMLTDNNRASGSGIASKGDGTDTFVIQVPSDLFHNSAGGWARAIIRESRNRILQSWGDGWDRNADRRAMAISPWAIPVPD